MPTDLAAYSASFAQRSGLASCPVVEETFGRRRGLLVVSLGLVRAYASGLGWDPSGLVADDASSPPVAAGLHAYAAFVAFVATDAYAGHFVAVVAVARP